MLHSLDEGLGLGVRGVVGNMRGKAIVNYTYRKTYY